MTGSTAKFRFQMPGWERGDDRVELLSPLKRRLRVAALSYTQVHSAFDASVADIGNGFSDCSAAASP